MKKNYLITLILFLCVGISYAGGIGDIFTKSPVDYVNPFIGTSAPGDGHTSPGATLPFGMTTWTPETREYGPNQGFPPVPYYYVDTTISGFRGSHYPSGAWMGLATSKDLIHWIKYGEILQPKYKWEKGQIKAGAIIPQRINGKYWMYYQGEREAWKTSIGLAYSEDLLHWKQLDKSVMEPRKNRWDSQGVEPGSAVVIPQGILLIYDGWDETTQNKGGWALFSKNDPAKLIARSDSPIISLPDKHVFATALIEFENKWYLYWGADDKWIDGAEVDLKALISQK